MIFTYQLNVFLVWLRFILLAGSIVTKRGGKRGVWKKIAFFSPFYCSLDRYWLHVEPAHIWLYSLVYLVSSEYLLLHFAVPKSPFSLFRQGFLLLPAILMQSLFFFTSMYVCPFFC